MGIRGLLLLVRREIMKIIKDGFGWLNKLILIGIYKIMEKFGLDDDYVGLKGGFYR